MSVAELATHVGSDLGVADLGRRLAARLDAFAILHNYSRLVVDMNRPPQSPESITPLSERTRIPSNESLAIAEAEQRVEALFAPYHERIRAELDRRGACGRPTVLVALHSFTPRYMDVTRPWHVGVLYRRDAGLGRAVLDLLRADPALVVGDNEPYALDDASDYTVIEHGERRGLPFVELEVRQDLLADAAGRQQWAECLAAVLEATQATAGKR
jgi:predicted N-formylglutamate amidohydrolase